MKSKIIKIRCNGILVQLPAEEIICCIAERSYTRIICDTKLSGILISKPIGFIENNYECGSLIRCHKSHLVNLKKVEFFSSKCRYVSVFGKKIAISRRKSAYIFQNLLDLGVPDRKNIDRSSNILTVRKEK